MDVSVAEQAPVDAARTSLTAISACASAIAVIARHVEALSRRFAASRFASQHAMIVLSRILSEMGWITSQAARSALANAAKLWEGAAEEARVRAAQLNAYAQLIEDDVDDSVGEAAAIALLAAACDDVFGVPKNVPHIDWEAADMCWEVAVATWLRDGVDCCDVSGDGIAFYTPGGDNCVTIAPVDCHGDVLESVEAGDVCVAVEGAAVVNVAVIEAGRVEVVFAFLRTRSRVPSRCH